MSEEANSTSTHEAVEKLAAAACIRCGYALKGLDPTSACPECGVPIEHSVAPWLLHAPTQDLQRLHSGLSLVAAFSILLAACWLISLCMWQNSLALELVTTALWAGLLWGCWRSTAEIQNLPHSESLAARRSLARTAVRCMTVAFLLGFFVSDAERLGVLTYPAALHAALIVVQVVAMAGIAWTLGRYFASFATSMRAGKAARAARLAALTGTLILPGWLPRVVEVGFPSLWTQALNSIGPSIEQARFFMEWLSTTAMYVVLAVMAGKVSAAIGRELQKRPEARSRRIAPQTGGDRWLYP